MQLLGTPGLLKVWGEHFRQIYNVQPVSNNRDFAIYFIPWYVNLSAECRAA